MTVHTMPHDYQEIIELLKHLPVKLKYTGSGLPNIAALVLLLLVNYCRQREYLTGEEKAELLERYDYSCAAYGTKPNDLEWDHVQALQSLAPGAKQVLQLLLGLLGLLLSMSSSTAACTRNTFSSQCEGHIAQCSFRRLCGPSKRSRETCRITHP